jgi:hypothetical protein
MKIGKSRAQDLNNTLHDITFDGLVKNLWGSVNMTLRTSVSGSTSSEILGVFSAILLIDINKG